MTTTATAMHGETQRQGGREMWRTRDREIARPRQRDNARQRDRETVRTRDKETSSGTKRHKGREATLQFCIIRTYHLRGLTNLLWL